MKRFSALMFVVLLVSAFAGCGMFGNSGDDTGETDQLEQDVLVRTLDASQDVKKNLPESLRAADGSVSRVVVDLDTEKNVTSFAWAQLQNNLNESTGNMEDMIAGITAVLDSGLDADTLYSEGNESVFWTKGEDGRIEIWYLNSGTTEIRVYASAVPVAGQVDVYSVNIYAFYDTGDAAFGYYGEYSEETGRLVEASGIIGGDYRVFAIEPDHDTAASTGYNIFYYGNHGTGGAEPREYFAYGWGDDNGGGIRIIFDEYFDENDDSADGSEYKAKIAYDDVYDAKGNLAAYSYGAVGEDYDNLTFWGMFTEALAGDAAVHTSDLTGAAADPGESETISIVYNAASEVETFALDGEAPASTDGTPYDDLFVPDTDNLANSVVKYYATWYEEAGDGDSNPDEGSAIFYLNGWNYDETDYNLTLWYRRLMVYPDPETLFGESVYFVHALPFTVFDAVNSDGAIATDANGDYYVELDGDSAAMDDPGEYRLIVDEDTIRDYIWSPDSGENGEWVEDSASVAARGLVVAAWDEYPADLALRAGYAELFSTVRSEVGEVQTALDDYFTESARNGVAEKMDDAKTLLNFSVVGGE